VDADQKKRLAWVKFYFKSNDAGLTCKRCGISRPTLRKWLKRYEANGMNGLTSRSSRPHSSPIRKLTSEVEQQIINLRIQRNIGARRIQIELGLVDDEWLSRTLIQKVLDRAMVKPLKKARRPATPKRYNRATPGERIQMDTMKICAGVYQYTAVDDCTRFRVLGLYPRRAGKYTLQFLERVYEEMPFPIQAVQTDRGTEFFAEQVQLKLKEMFIKFRPIPPRSPHLNGKVERSQLTDLQEFWAIRLKPSMEDANDLETWQFDYNWRRPHGSLAGLTPCEHLGRLIENTPDTEAVANAYEPAKEHMRFSNSKVDAAAKVARELSQNQA
jgi:transposase InsO family protein